MRPLKFPTLVVIALVAVVVGSQATERFVNRVLRPDIEEWEWISEAVVIAAFGVMTALWVRLRLAHAAIADLERERLTVETELKLAATVQRALLPSIPDPTHDVAWYAVMEPARQIGGDYYDFFPLGDDRMCVVLADVSGKGAPAAVFASNVRGMLRAVAHEQPTPKRILATVSEMVLRDGHGALYVTCLVGIVDTARRTILYTNAGHPPGVILSTRQRIRALGIGGPPLGLVSGAEYEEEFVALEPGDLVVLVSDGITDAIDASGDEIPAAISARLADLRQKTPEVVCATLLEAARLSNGPAGVSAWADDRTVVAFGLSGAIAPQRGESAGPSSQSHRVLTA